MSEEIIIGYKFLIPTEIGWRSPVFHCTWTDRAQANSKPSEEGPTGIYGVFDPSDCKGYYGVLVRIQAFGQVVLGERGFRAEEALILDYDEDERNAFLFFELADTTTKIELGIRCALSVYPDPKFHRWADNWINGKDRSVTAAKTAAGYSTATRAANAAAWAALEAGGYSAAANAAAWAASAAAALAAKAAAWAAAWAALEAAWSAAKAAAWAAAAWAAALEAAAEEEVHPLIVAIRQYREAHGG